jgi:hypothetical protein
LPELLQMLSAVIRAPMPLLILQQRRLHKLEEAIQDKDKATLQRINSRILLVIRERKEPNRQTGYPKILKARKQMICIMMLPVMTVVGQVKIAAARALAESLTIGQMELLIRILATLDLGNKVLEQNGIAIPKMAIPFCGILCSRFC